LIDFVIIISASCREVLSKIFHPTAQENPLNILTIDLGGSHIACAAIVEGKLHARRSMGWHGSLLAPVLPWIASSLGECLLESGRLSFDGVAVGFCGIVDTERQEILSVLNKYIDAPSLDLKGWALREFKLPLRLANDASLALLGEASRGAARGAQDVVMVTLGTGIGGAAMLGGRLLHSRAGQAGCLGGHLPVNFRGRRCACGAIGCAEAEASTAMLPQVCREHPAFPASRLAQEPVLDFKAVFRAFDAGDTVAKQVLDHCLAVWGALTVGLIHAYGPEIVIFGGGILERRDDLLPRIRAYVAQHMWRTSHGLPRIEPAELGDTAALLGGAALFEQQTQTLHG
jgi:glucokinase